MNVFFYGLFMDESLLALKGIVPLKTSIGRVDGYALRIGKRATLVPAKGECAHGVLMRLRPDDVQVLYSEKSVADYAPETVSVVLSDGSSTPAVCYNLAEDKIEGTNRDYAKSLLALAERLELPDDYIEQIRAGLH